MQCFSIQPRLPPPLTGIYTGIYFVIIESFLFLFNRGFQIVKSFLSRRNGFLLFAALSGPLTVTTVPKDGTEDGLFLHLESYPSPMFHRFFSFRVACFDGTVFMVVRGFNG